MLWVTQTSVLPGTSTLTPPGVVSSSKLYMRDVWHERISTTRCNTGCWPSKTYRFSKRYTILALSIIDIVQSSRAQRSGDTWLFGEVAIEFGYINDEVLKNMSNPEGRGKDSPTNCYQLSAENRHGQDRCPTVARTVWGELSLDSLMR